MTRVGICSYGYATKVFHAPLISSLPRYYEIGAIVERHSDQASAQFPSATIYRSCEEMFSDPTIDLVVVNTPNTTHFEFAYKALLMGKHVVVDKPFAATMEEGRCLMGLAERQNRLLTVFHNRRWEGELLMIQELVDKGILGRLLEVEFKFERYRLGLNPKAHKEVPSKANGIVYELGTHLIDQSIYLFGMPEAVHADIDKVRPDSLVDDRFSIQLYYPNQLIVRLKSSLLIMEQGPAYILHGDQGSFTKHRANVQEMQLAGGVLPGDPHFAQEPMELDGRLTSRSDDGSMQSVSCHSSPVSYLGFYLQLAEALGGKSRVPVEPKDALDGLRIIAAAYKSVAEHRRVDIE